MLAGFALLFMIIALAFNQLIGIVWFRARPEALIDFNNISHTVAGTKSFPSDHVTAAFALAIPLFFVSWKWGWFGILVGVITAFCRVVLGVHFPSDVIAGAVIGAGWGLLAGWAFKKYQISNNK